VVACPHMLGYKGSNPFSCVEGDSYGEISMKVAIVGSRSITNCKEIIEESLRGMEVTEIVSGGAKGVDTVAKSMQKIIILNIKSFFQIIENTEITHHSKEMMK